MSIRGHAISVLYSTKEDIVEYAVRMFFEGGSSKFGDAENMEFKLEGLNVNRYQMLHTQMALQNPLPC